MSLGANVTLNILVGRKRQNCVIITPEQARLQANISRQAAGLRIERERDAMRKKQLELDTIVNGVTNQKALDSLIEKYVAMVDKVLSSHLVCTPVPTCSQDFGAIATGRIYSETAL